MEREIETFTIGPRSNGEGCIVWHCPFVPTKNIKLVKYEKYKKAIEALTTISRQPFNGSWDAQAVFIQNTLAELR